MQFVLALYKQSQNLRRSMTDFGAFFMVQSSLRPEIAGAGEYPD
jgi:hypothetical protein